MEKPSETKSIHNLLSTLSQFKKQMFQKAKEHKRFTAFLIFLFLFDLATFAYFTEKQPFYLFTPSFNDEANLIDITIFLPDKDMKKFVSAKRGIYPYEKDTEKIEAIFSELASRPSKVDTIRAIPLDVDLRRVWTHNDIIFIDLRKSIRKVKLVNADQEKFLFYGLTKSILTHLPKYKGVQFLVGGKEVDLIWGSVDLTRPLTLGKKAP